MSMTVEQLIERLKVFPPYHEVTVEMDPGSEDIFGVDEVVPGPRGVVLR